MPERCPKSSWKKDTVPCLLRFALLTRGAEIGCVCRKDWIQDSQAGSLSIDRTLLALWQNPFAQNQSGLEPKEGSSNFLARGEASDNLCRRKDLPNSRRCRHSPSTNMGGGDFPTSEHSQKTSHRRCFSCTAKGFKSICKLRIIGSVNGRFHKVTCV